MGNVPAYNSGFSSSDRCDRDFFKYRRFYWPSFDRRRVLKIILGHLIHLGKWNYLLRHHVPIDFSFGIGVGLINLGRLDPKEAAQHDAFIGTNGPRVWRVGRVNKAEPRTRQRNSGVNCLKTFERSESCIHEFPVSEQQRAARAGGADLEPSAFTI